MGERKRAVPNAHESIKHHTRCNSNAQALVELALILPILMVLIVGALEFGRLWSTKIVLTNAAREGAYYLSTHNTETNCQVSGGVITSVKAVQAALAEANDSGVTLDGGDISITGSSCASGSMVEVTAATTVNNLLILGFVGNVFNITHTIDSMPLSSSVQMMIQ